jgi:hypothetical protein
LLNLIDDVSRNPKIRGIDDWLRFSIQLQNKRGDDLLRTLEELREARRLANQVGANQVVRIGGDLNRPGRSFDIEVVDETTGALSRSIEVTTVTGVNSAGGIFPGIRHGIDKATGVGLPGGTREVSVRVDFQRSIPQGPNTRRVGPDGSWEITDPSGSVRATGNFVADAFIRMQRELPNLNQLDEIHVTDVAGRIIGHFRRDVATGAWRRLIP